MNLNLVTVIVLLVLGLNLYEGYRDGFIRVIYSLVSWLIVLAMVTWMTPYITNFIEKETGVQSFMCEKLETYFKERIEQDTVKVEGNSLEMGSSDETDASDSRTYNSFSEGLEEIGIGLPDEIIRSITKGIGQTATQMIEESKIYENLALGISHFIIQGFAFFLALTIARFLVRYIEHTLRLISRLPVLHTMNKVLGLAAGGIKALLIIWLAFYLVALLSTSALGIAVVEEIRESQFLTYLYRNNLLLKLILGFM